MMFLVYPPLSLPLSLCVWCMWGLTGAGTSVLQQGWQCWLSPTANTVVRSCWQSCVLVLVCTSVKLCLYAWMLLRDFAPQAVAVSLAQLAPAADLKNIFVDKAGLDVLLDLLTDRSATASEYRTRSGCWVVLCPAANREATGMPVRRGFSCISVTVWGCGHLSCCLYTQNVDSVVSFHLSPSVCM